MKRYLNVVIVLNTGFVHQIKLEKDATNPQKDVLNVVKIRDKFLEVEPDFDSDTALQVYDVDVACEENETTPVYTGEFVNYPKNNGYVAFHDPYNYKSSF